MNALPTAWLFPGQGSQSIGMGRELLATFEPAAELLSIASELVGVDLAPIIARGPEALLTRTEYLQPAITAINLGCCLWLEHQGLKPDAVAGHSLGEFSALSAARVLTPEAVLKLVTERGRLMHEVARTLDGGMMAVKAISIDLVVPVVLELSRTYAIGIANHNSPVQVVISGDRTGLARAAERLTPLGGVIVPLNVSGPWHSPLMGPAALRFAAILRGEEFHDAQIPVVMNANGQALISASEIRAVMETQLCSPVRWVQVLGTMFERGVRKFVEVGPGKVLRGLVRRLPELAECEVVNVDNPNALRFLAETSLEKGSA